jgi:hypothetical protein
MLGMLGLAISVVPGVVLRCGEYEKSNLVVVAVDPVGVDAEFVLTGIVDSNIEIKVGIVPDGAVAGGSEAIGVVEIVAADVASKIFNFDS